MGFPPREKGHRKSHKDLHNLPMLDRLPTCTLRMQIPDTTNLLEEQAMISSKAKAALNLQSLAENFLL